MANYTVKNLTGDALTEGSLLYAIAQVNAGLYDGITFDSSLNGSVIDFSELETLNGTVSVSNGTLDNFTGEITVTSEGDGYGITGSRGTRSITNSTGSITVNASANAYGINSYFQESTSYYDRTTSLDFNSMALNLTIASTTSDAFGIRMYSYLYRVSNYSDYRKSTCKLIADDIVGDISVNAALCGYGINLYGYGDGGNGYANLDVDTISSHITVTGGTDAYGIYAYGSASNGAEISVKELNENVDITAGTGTAYGIYSSGKINGGYKEVVTKEAEYAEDGTLISEAVTESQEQAMIVSGHVTVSSESGAAYGVATNGSMLLSIADTGKISGNSTNGTAYGVWTGGLLTLKSMAGEIILNTEGTAGTTIGIHAASGMFENITGNINVTTSAAGYGIGGSYGSRNITNSTGSITVKAIDRAVGIEGNYSYNYSNATTSLTFDEMALLLNITSSSKDAYGIRLNTNNDYYYYHNEVRSNLTTGDITGHITVTGALDGYGIYLYGRSGFGYANLDAETISSNITVNGGTDAYGIYAYGSASNGAEISVKELNGNVDITAGTGYRPCMDLTEIVPPISGR